MRGLVRWRDGIVTQSNPPYAVDVARGRTTPLELPIKAEVRTIASSGATLAVVARDTELHLRVFERRTDAWIECPLPAELIFDDAMRPALAVGDGWLALIIGSRLYRFEAQRWTIRQLELPPNSSIARRGGLDVTAVRGRRVYVGFNVGEWGGDLLSFDVDRGLARRERTGPEDPEDSLGVSALEIDSKGVLWAVRGGNGGSLHRLDPGGWTLIASVRWPWRNAETSCRTGWTLPATSFDALGFDRAGRPLLLTHDFGVLRREPNGAWTHLTPSLRDANAVAGLSTAPSTLVIGTRDAGVVLWDLEVGHATVVPLIEAPP